ncbi:MAG: tRNA (guanosine(37)-N1)-methyltransferase TrmD [Clostridiaceae bacterium]|nr:tRNA (guanosine(37)-N1)-methyltransferase TrmD [Clostridiaceae bacterium]
MSRISILTLFPEQIIQGLAHSIVGKAIENGILELDFRNIRDFAINKHGQVDDALYGGGTGMLMMLEPIIKSWLSIYIEDPNQYLAELPAEMDLEKWRSQRKQISKDTLYFLSPKGKVFDQTMAKNMAKQEHLVFLCGHYEGVDQRVIDILEPEEISLGDFVLTGGESALIVIIDAISRLLPGVLPNKEAYLEDSHAQGYLEEVQYTRPAKWYGVEVPEVLLSGHQANIAEFRKHSRMRETIEKRPDLITNLQFTKEEWLSFLAELD